MVATCDIIVVWQQSPSRHISWYCSPGVDLAGLGRRRASDSDSKLKFGAEGYFAARSHNHGIAGERERERDY